MANMNEVAHCLKFEDIEAAASRIDCVAHRTPLLTCTTIDAMMLPNSCRLFFKVEALQKTGSFKFRGALNAVKKLLEQNDVKDNLHVVTHSSGNHAQALALAAKLASSTLDIPVKATIVMPETAPTVKVNAVCAYGGKPIMVANTHEARTAGAKKIQDDCGATFVHPSEDPNVIAGQGTVCLEMVQQMEELGQELDVVVIPVGGGGLAAGNAITLRSLLGTNVKIVLAEPSALDDAKRSFEAKKLLKHQPSNKLDSVADGLKTTLGNNTWPVIRDLVDDILTVTEIEILKATKIIWERLKICVEPSAGVAVAVALSSEFQNKFGCNQNVGIVLCGGNVDILKTAELMRVLDM